MYRKKQHKIYRMSYDEIAIIKNLLQFSISQYLPNYKLDYTFFQIL